MSTIYIPVADAQTRRKEGADVALSVLGAFVCLGMMLSLSRLWERSGAFIGTAWIAAVNDSVWEHVKIVCIPLLMWQFAEYFVLHVNYRRLIAAAVWSAWGAAIFQVCVTLIYMGILGFAVRAVDLAIAAGSISLGQWLAARVRCYPGRVEEYYLWYAAALALLLYALLSFTVNPPHLGLFADPVRGTFGFR